MVGEDDESVRPRGVRGGVSDRSDCRINAIECGEGLDALGAAMVGELVVVGEVRIDHVGAPIHLVDDE